MRHSRALAILFSGVLLLIGGRFGGTATAGPGGSYTAQLSGAEEVPARTTPASGMVALQVSPDGQSITYSVTVSDITNVRMGHIHIGPKGTNGDIVLPLVPTAPPGGGPRSGVIGQGTATAAELTGPLQGKTLADLVAEMDAGNAYVNIHTGSGANPATLQPGDLPPGEIRGQIALTTAPATMPTTLPNTGGGYTSGTGFLPWLLLAAALTAVLARTLVRFRRA
jgi:hypothetical protein